MHISRGNHNSERHMHTNIHRSTIYCSQDTEAPYMSTDRGVNKEDVAHVYSGLLLSYKK